MFSLVLKSLAFLRTYISLCFTLIIDDKFQFPRKLGLPCIELRMNNRVENIFIFAQCNSN